MQIAMLLALTVINEPYVQSDTPVQYAAIGILVTIGISLLVSAAAIAISELIRPSPDIEDAKPSGKGDLQFPTAEEGRPVPLIWGRVKISGPNVIWWGDFRQKAIKEKVKTGLFSSKRVTVGYSYFVGIDMAVCRGGASTVSLVKVFVGDKELPLTGGPSSYEVDDRRFFGGNEFGNGGIVGTLTWHEGSTTQSPNTYLQGFLEPLSGQRGTAHAVWEGGYIGNSTRIAPWSFEVERYPDDLQSLAAAELGGSNQYTSGHHKVNSFDSNPMEVAFEILTDTDWGLSIPTNRIDVTSFADAAETLFDEGNGFSMQLERQITARELLDLVQNQADCMIYQDRTTGLYTVKLARDDYTVASLRAINDGNTIEVDGFSRQTWDKTTNQVRIKFADRSRDYFETFARADSLGNLQMQGDNIVSSTINMPGVKNGSLANDIAARELRLLSFPLANASLKVNREMWDVQPAEIVRWTNSDLGITDLPMRVKSVDYGTLKKSEISIQLVQDVFSLEAGFFGTPPATDWTLPTQGVEAIPEDEHRVFEAPRAIVVRDPVNPTPEDRVFVGARAQAGEVSIDIETRHGTAPLPGTGTLPFELDGAVEGLFLIGNLNVALNSEDANPTTTIQITGAPDSLSSIDLAFDTEPATDTEIGVELANILMIDDEFIGVSDFNASTGQFSRCWRGLMDSVPADHAAGAKVYCLWVAGGINDSELPAGDAVEVRPITVSRDEELDPGDAVVFDLTMANRYRRPYPPYRLDLNSVRFDTSASITSGLTVDWYRRHFETEDEVESLSDDAANLVTGFTGLNNHENRVRMVDGESIELVANAWLTGTTDTLGRADILKKTNAALPSGATVRVGARHDVGALANLESRVELSHEVTLTDSEISGLQNLGTLGANVASGAYTVVDDTVDHNFRLEGGTLSANVQYQLNGISGAWSTLISTGSTTGTISSVSLSPGDEIYIRHVDNSDTDNNVVLFGDEDGTDVLYGVLTDDAEWENLQGFWSMDESSTGVGAVDRVARYGSGTPDLADQNTATSQSGDTLFGNAVRCLQTGGVLEHLRVANASAGRIIPTGAFTIMAWVYINSGGTDSTKRHFVSVTDLSSGGPSFTDRLFELFIDGSDRLGASVYDNTGDDGSGALTTDTMSEEGWHHIVLAFDGGQYRVYLDGTVGTTVSSTIGGALNSTTEDFVVGGADSGGSPSLSDSQLDCRIDDLRMYDRVLSGAEIAEIAGRSTPV